MRVTTLVRSLLAVTSLVVTRVRMVGPGILIATVRPRWHKPRCGECGKRAPGYDTLVEPRLWRTLSFGPVEVFLEYVMRRVRCRRCRGVRVEQVPWAARGSRFTRQFEELIAYLAQVTDKTTVTKLTGVSWRAVGHIVERIIAERLDSSRLDGLRRIGVDEFSYRKRHRYITTVVNHDTGRVVWASEGKGADTLGAFFDELGRDRLAKLETITIDMAAGYLAAIRARAAHVEIVFDRFHVQALASRAVDDVRRQQWRQLQGTPEGQAIKNTRWALLKNRWDLSGTQRHKLSAVQKNNQRLYRAYLLKETLAHALAYLQPKRAADALDDWLAWASRSRLQPFVVLARTIRKHKQGILAYVKWRLTNAVVEGINNRLRMVARRAFGFHTPKALIAMLFLCCGGIPLDPPLPGSAH